jgi:PAS domain S-box-containing protein
VDERTRKLHESEERYRELFEACPVSLWEEDFSAVKQFLDEFRQKGVSDFSAYLSNHPEDTAKCAALVKVLNMNRATLNLYSAKSVDEIIGGLSGVLTEQSNRAFVGEVVALVQGKKYYEAEFENRTLSGETKHCNVICAVVPGYEQSLAKVLICIVDLTPQKKLEAELRASRERLEYVVASNPAVLYLEKPLPDLSDTVSTFVSESATSVLGFEPKNFLGESGLNFWRSRIHPDDLARYWAELPILWSDGHHTFEYRFLHSDGTYRWIRDEYKVIRDTEGHILDIASVAIDVTERVKLYEKLTKAERLAAIGQTAAMVGHDLRNPLQGIAGALHLLKQDSLTAEERNEMLQVIEKSIRYSDAIVRDLSEYSSEIQLKLAEATPKSVTRDSIEAVKVPQNVIIQDLSEDHPTLRADPDKMKRVFINLIENAIDAMPQGGTLTISSKKSDRNVEIAVTDTGSGMSQKVMENLWKPLQTTKAKGLGLGLAICKRIVDAHGGTISVKSKDGEGTTVTIGLPIKPVGVEVKEK